MTTPPLPASPCLKVNLDYTQSDGYEGGSRFYLGYSGSAPTGANCITLAGDIEAAWLAHLAPLINPAWALTEVDVLDIASNSGFSGQWTGNEAGTRDGTEWPSQVATNVEFNIARRYRGGKPRMFLPPGNQADGLDAGHWSTDFIDEVNTGIRSFFMDVEALTVGSLDAISHVNLSYYAGFTNVTNSSGRTRAAPKYRAAALLDVVSGYSCKGVMGSQKRRRTAATY